MKSLELNIRVNITFNDRSVEETFKTLTTQQQLQKEVLDIVGKYEVANVLATSKMTRVTTPST